MSYIYGRDVDDVVINHYGMPLPSGTLDIYETWSDADAGTDKVASVPITYGRWEYESDLPDLWVVAAESEPYHISALSGGVLITTAEITDMSDVGRAVAKAASTEAGRDAIGAASKAQGTKADTAVQPDDLDAAIDGVDRKFSSTGGNLILNGNGALGADSPYPGLDGFTYDPAAAPLGCYAGWTVNLTTATTINGSQRIYLDPTAKYTLSLMAKATTAVSLGAFYFDLIPYDADGNAISAPYGTALTIDTTWQTYTTDIDPLTYPEGTVAFGLRIRISGNAVNNDLSFAGFSMSQAAAAQDAAEQASQDAAVALQAAQKAVQPEALADIATTGKWEDLVDPPTIPSKPADVGAATAAQGAKADTAVQPASLGKVATSNKYLDLTGRPKINNVQLNANTTLDALGVATAAQGAKADTALQPVVNEWDTSDLVADSTNASGGWIDVSSGASGARPYGILVRNKTIIVLSVGWKHSGPQATASANGNLADITVGKINNDDLCPVTDIEVMIGYPGYPGFWGRLTTLGTLTITAGTFPGQVLDTGTTLRVYAQYVKL